MEPEKIADDAVLKFDYNSDWIPSSLFTFKDWEDFLSEEKGARHFYDQGGARCQILTPGNKWRRGRVKLTFEFIPDEPDDGLN
ncbi:hypothetical protein L3556_06355 [Candidatus Synechococcus calcipolaris G9]|uniref:KGK domain-containing protein n=1 Tax=Candidatus Synechococcus calcipolaris G9 TaxID=1497997 RepID=A0ABT6EXT4_9SYNE|nr:KGK domain-containing protein [Candidatus Synechococcus calcipolaris]MDG2990557.1 hypothetical protein [Candidatus Synechococcus calcipolaris G9]